MPPQRPPRGGVGGLAAMLRRNDRTAGALLELNLDRATHTPPPAGWIRFRSLRTPAVSTTWELTGPIVPAGGYGSVTTTQVPGGVSLTSYGGRDTLSLRIPVGLDRFSDDTSIERDVLMLERIMGVRPGHPAARPVSIVLEGAGIRHGYPRRPGQRWTLSDPDWDTDAEIMQTGDTGKLVRAGVTVVATEINRPDPDDVEDLALTDRRYHQVKAGSSVDTLREVAKRAHVPWAALIALNPQLPHDPDRRLPPNTRVRIA